MISKRARRLTFFFLAVTAICVNKYFFEQPQACYITNTSASNVIEAPDFYDDIYIPPIQTYFHKNDNVEEVFVESVKENLRSDINRWFSNGLWLANTSQDTVSLNIRLERFEAKTKSIELGELIPFRALVELAIFGAGERDLDVFVGAEYDLVDPNGNVLAKHETLFVIRSALENNDATLSTDVVSMLVKEIESDIKNFALNIAAKSERKRLIKLESLMQID
ncbi:hypothetical protein F0231_08400 [Vibrio sp. RE86]|uniref:hypothetical protein n=1 Tax=Vibrio sp. RE86 TaxID=2607605 RepID=UPI001493632A|nr:hypothetical protein [Vibrio sp. RE86]NOH79764.1 hypothetical protein [Vibrio sp. RE86]